jgi:hypothetical protein
MSFVSSLLKANEKENECLLFFSSEKQAGRSSQFGGRHFFAVDFVF